MKHIQKKISLEQFKSRMPSIVSAYNLTDELNMFDGSSYPYSNYNMIPTNILWNYGAYSGKYVSYNTVVSWFHFYKDYYNGLSTKDKCPISYRNYVEYFNNDVECPLTIEECQDLDTKFEAIGGKEGYNYMCTTLFPRFIINQEMIDAWGDTSYNIDDLLSIWKTDTLYVNDIINWIGWFDERTQYQELTSCNIENIDCCDCEEYFQRGGNYMHNTLKEYLSNLQDKLQEYNESYVDYYDQLVEAHKQLAKTNDQELIDNIRELIDKVAAINLFVYISNSIDNMGEFSIFSEEWEGGVDYSSSYSTSGVVVSYNGNDWITNDNSKGYMYSDTYKEFYFGTESGMNLDEKELYNDGNNNITIGKNKESFIRQIKQYQGNNVQEFTPHFSSYAYTKDGHFVKDPTKEKMAEKYMLNRTENGCFIINNTIYEVLKISEYIFHKNAYYEVLYDASNNPYCIIDNRKHFGVYNEDNDTYLIENEDILTDGFFIDYNNNLLLIENDKVTINGISYPKIVSYINMNNKLVMFNDSYQTVIYRYSDDENSQLELVETNNIIGTYGNDYGYSSDEILVYVDYIVYDSQYITGYTESKLSSLFSDDIVMYDAIGNKLPGLLRKEDKKYVEPSEGEWLDIFYKPMNMSHLSKEDENKCWGNIIEELLFYYEDKNGNIIGETKIAYSISSNTYSSSLEAISECIEKKNVLEKEDKIGKKYGYLSDLKCDIKYHMGATFTYDGKSVTIDDSGVTYIDTVSLIPSKCYYYISPTFCYELNYYDLQWEYINYNNNDYNNKLMSVHKAKFIIPTMTNDNDYGFTAFPLLREEYKFGTSSLENIKTDIYIDRGTSRAIDSHLKLMEVHSMESLENYGNSSFNIIKN